jgi:hypothetical protein
MTTTTATTLETVQDIIANTPKGANIVVGWTRPVKVKKAFEGVNLVKVVRMVGRIGIDYDNMKSVQEKRENGELPAENKGLPWGQWHSECIIEHKGKHYLRLYNGTSKHTHPSVSYLLDGKEIDKAHIENMCLASELNESKGDCFTCTLENMTQIHREEIPA